MIPKFKGSDAIDRFTTDILRHPEQADALKARLRQSLGVVAANSEPARAARAGASHACELEDFWDNVPV